MRKTRASLFIALFIVACESEDPSKTNTPEEPSPPSPASVLEDRDNDGAMNNTDCDDNNPSRYPGAEEICDGIDNDCNDAIDDKPTDGTLLYVDSDGDGFGIIGVEIKICAETAPPGFSFNSGDCNDSRNDTHPGATEVCDGRDNDCNDSIDDITEVINIFVDEDQDGFGAGSPETSDSCTLPSGYSFIGGDCNDTEAAIHPSAEEICDEQNTDEDCDGFADDLDPQGATGKQLYSSDAQDQDGDGYSAHSGTGSVQLLCDGQTGLLLAGDCNDNHPFIKPNASGYCASSTALALGRYLSCGLVGDGTIHCWGYAYDEPPTVPAGNDFIAVAEGAPYYCGLRSDGSVACVDNNNSNFDPVATPTDSDFIALAGGENFMCGLHQTGAYSCWGSRYDSRTPESFVHIEGGRKNLCGIRHNGTVGCVGSNTYGINNPPGYSFREITVGPKHACGILTDGSITCWGDNSESQLTAPSGADFTAISGSTYMADATCALRENGKITCWGDDAPESEKLPSEYNFHLLDSGHGFVCGMDNSGHLECVGSSIGGSSHSPTYTGLTHLIADQGQSSATVCYIYNGGTHCFGLLAEQYIDWTSSAPIISMAASSKRAIALHSDGSLTNLIGTQTPPEPPEGAQMQRIEVGGSHWNNRYHYCGLYDNGQLQCWHANNLGQATPPETQDFTGVTLGADFSCGLHQGGSVTCWGDESDNQCDAPESIAFDKIDAAQHHTCGITQQGAIDCWGNENNLPSGMQSENYTELSTGPHQTCAIGTAGVITCYQHENSPRRLNPPADGGFTSVATGVHFGCALNTQGQLTCFGDRYIRPLTTFLP